MTNIKGKNYSLDNWTIEVKRALLKLDIADKMLVYIVNK